MRAVPRAPFAAAILLAITTCISNLKVAARHCRSTRRTPLGHCGWPACFGVRRRHLTSTTPSCDAEHSPARMCGLPARPVHQALTSMAVTWQGLAHLGGKSAPTFSRPNSVFRCEVNCWCARRAGSIRCNVLLNCRGSRCSVVVYLRSLEGGWSILNRGSVRTIRPVSELGNTVNSCFVGWYCSCSQYQISPEWPVSTRRQQVPGVSIWPVEGGGT